MPVGCGKARQGYGERGGRQAKHSYLVRHGEAIGSVIVSSKEQNVTKTIVSLSLSLFLFLFKSRDVVLFYFIFLLVG